MPAGLREAEEAC